MKTTLSKDQKVAFWRQHIALANQYPDGIQKYCDANGLASQTFYYWKFKLNARRKNKVAKLTSTTPFAEVQVCKPEVLRKQDLPDAKWLAEFVLHLSEATK